MLKREYIEEYRLDPMNNELYTEQEFYDYYGRGLEWELQHPFKTWRRTKINEMIYEFNCVHTEMMKQRPRPEGGWGLRHVMKGHKYIYFVYRILGTNTHQGVLLNIS